ncbi:MAG: protein kinase [Candidatus Cloacimonetes bacterium]|nr:protein kinase [Candidatus Cloacimonadota bacterium]
MPFCNKCGTIIEDSDKFCPKCGSPNKLSTNSESPAGTIQENISSSKTINANEQGGYGFDLSKLPQGYEIENRYRIEEKLGRGGFGTVYKAWDNNVDKFKALKVIDNIFYDDKRVIADLKHEALLLMELNSKYVVRIWDIHLKGEIKFIDMEYIEGGDLEDLLLSYPDRRVPEKKVIKLIEQISKGMSDIHKHRIIHKDLKPQNIMLTQASNIKIMDFGISETFRSSKSRLKETSRSGTPVYMSPEQLLGKDVGRESDIWSFGLLIYELLSGKQLYNGQSTTEVMMQIKERPDYEPIAGISNKTNRLLQKCIKYDYKDRFRNFGEISDYFNEIPKPKITSKKIEHRNKPVKKSYFYKKRKEKPQANSPNIVEVKNIEKNSKLRLDTKIALIWMGLSIVLLLIFSIIYTENGIMISTIASIVSGIFLIIKRRKNIKNLEISLYWLGLSIVLFPLLLIIFEEMDICFGSFDDDELGPMVATIITIMSGIFIMWKRQWEIKGTEISIYWLGLGLAFHYQIAVIFESLDVDFLGFHDFEAGLFVTAIVLVFSLALLIKKRYKKIKGVEIAIYWLGLSFIICNTISFTSGQYIMSISIFISLISGLVLIFLNRKKIKICAVEFIWICTNIVLGLILKNFFYRTGYFYASMVAILSGFILVMLKRKKIKKIETATYWLGFSIALNYLFIYIFEEMGWQFWNLYDERSGSFVAGVISIISGLYLIKKRRGNISKIEKAIYATGLILLIIIFSFIK